MLPHPQGRFLHYGLLLAVGILLFLLNLGQPSLWDLDEGRNATAALEMMESGNWIVPTFNGQLRVHKPVLLYWLQVGAYQVFGINEFAARLPSALAALVTLLLTYELGRSLFNAGTGLVGSLILASTPMVCGAARFANPDALLNLFVVLTFLLFWRSFVGGKKWWPVGIGAACGLAVLAKGPVGLVLPGAILGLFLIWTRNLSLLRNRLLILGIWIFCGTALPWYIWVAVETKANFLRGFLLTHNVNRFLSPMENHAGSPLYYLVVLILGFAPWSAFLGLATWFGLRNMVGPSRRTGPTDSLNSSPPNQVNGEIAVYRLLVCWIGVYLLFFSVSATKLPNYILPMTIPLALLIARFFDRWAEGFLVVPKWAWLVSLGGLVVVGAGSSLALLILSGKVDLGGLWTRPLHRLSPWAGIGLVPVAGAGLAWHFVRKNQPQGFLVSVLVTAVLFLAPLAAWMATAWNQQKPAQPLVARAGALQRDQDIRIGCWQLEHLPSLNFYCQRDVLHHQSEQEVLNFLRHPLPVFLFLPENSWLELEKKAHTPFRLVSRHEDVYRGGRVVVVTNQ